MHRRVAIAILMSAVLLVVAPMAMVIFGCPLMGPMCEGLCGASSCAVRVPTLSAVPTLTSHVPLIAEGHLPANAVPDLEHPPRSFGPSA